jgi:hypothetical protein
MVLHHPLSLVNAATGWFSFIFEKAAATTHSHERGTNPQHMDQHKRSREWRRSNGRGVGWGFKM